MTVFDDFFDFKTMLFSLDGSDRFNNAVLRDIQLIGSIVAQSDIGGDLSGLVLGGGYGRGEGGVYLKGAEEFVYNDYDFFVFTRFGSRFRRKKISETLCEIKKQIEPLCGIHVDFSPPILTQSISRLPYELMFMELKAGHHVVIGPPDLLSSIPNYDVARPPLEECARLFMNRGVGLLLARQKLEGTAVLSAEDHEFVVRNIRKAQMAMGDSVLFLNECYSPSYVERSKRFSTLSLTNTPCPDLLSSYYSEAIEFKLRPQHAVPQGHTLQTWHAEVTEYFGHMFLWFEQQRLATPNLTWADYSKRFRRLPYKGVKESVFNIWRNFRVRNAGWPRIREWTLHPRDRVLARLPAQLFSPNSSKDAECALIALWQPHG